MQIVVLSNHPAHGATHPSPVAAGELRAANRPHRDDDRQVISLINDSTTTITGAECAQIERLIIRDHKFHAKRRTS